MHEYDIYTEWFLRVFDYSLNAKANRLFSEFDETPFSVRFRNV